MKSLNELKTELMNSKDRNDNPNVFSPWSFDAGVKAQAEQYKYTLGIEAPTKVNQVTQAELGASADSNQTTCKDCGVETTSGAGSARCKECWADKTGSASAEVEFDEGAIHKEFRESKIINGKEVCFEPSLSYLYMRGRKDQFNANRAALSAMKGELSDMQNMQSFGYKESKAKIEKLRTENAELNHELTNRSQALVNLRSDWLEAMAKVDKLRAKCGDLIDENRDYRKAALGAEVDKLHNEAEFKERLGLVCDRSILTIEVKKLNVEIEQREQSSLQVAATFKAELDKLRTEIEKLRSENESASQYDENGNPK